MEEKQSIVVAKHIEALSPLEIPTDKKVTDKFIELYEAIHGKGLGRSMYSKEQFNFAKLLEENVALQSCSKLSLYGAFLDIAVNGLSLDNSSKPLCYLIPRACKTGRKDDKGKDIYEKRVSVSITAYGELVMRKRAGQINYADNPVIVYEGDLFEPELDSMGRKTIKYKAAIPRKSKKIIAAFIRIVRNDGSIDYQWMLEDDIERLKGYSSKANSYYDKNGQFVQGQANKLYTANDGQIDPGFLENKMIKHAFDAYPKVRTGAHTQLETQQEPEINYNLAETTDTTAEDVTNKDDKTAFGATNDKHEGITIEDNTEAF